MSRIGKQPITLPAGVVLKRENHEVIIEGPKGALRKKIPSELDLDHKEDKVFVVIKKSTKEANALQGTFRQIVKNMIEGVTKGFEKKLEIAGLGYKVSLRGNTLVFSLGFSHPVEFKIPEGISVNVEKNIITISGIDKELVGQTAAGIYHLKPVEPYKGKGIKYFGEEIKRKLSKKAKASK